jgi:hypothetical protein
MYGPFCMVHCWRREKPSVTIFPKSFLTLFEHLFKLVFLVPSWLIFFAVRLNVSSKWRDWSGPRKTFFVLLTFCFLLCYLSFIPFCISMSVSVCWKKFHSQATAESQINGATIWCRNPKCRRPKCRKTKCRKNNWECRKINENIEK